MINTWNESLLHEELKDYYCGENGRKEVPLEGSICDAIRDDGSIVEIQTAHLGKLKVKLEKLLKNRKVELVYPIAKNILIETYDENSMLLTRRKSPKHGTVYQLFKELTGLYPLLDNPRFTLTVVIADILEIRVADGTGSWRRKGIRRDDKKLVKIHESRPFNGKSAYAALIPREVPELFTVKDLKAAGAGVHAGCMAWVLRKAGIIELCGKKERSYLYRRAQVHESSGSVTVTLVPVPTSETTATVP